MHRESTFRKNCESVEASNSEMGAARLLKRIAAAATLAAFLLAASVPSAPAAVFHGREEIPRLAFPEADRVETKNFFLTPEQRSRIERLSHSQLESDLLTVYVAFRNEAVHGYAVVDTHIVRTLPETLLVVLSTDGEVTSIELLAFHEPVEYLPGKHWLAALRGKREAADVRVGRGVAGITGSTLTSRAVAASLRRALAVFQVLLREDQ